jgi:hypothetical protein
MGKDSLQNAQLNFLIMLWNKWVIVVLMSVRRILSIFNTKTVATDNTFFLIVGNTNDDLPYLSQAIFVALGVPGSKFEKHCYREFGSCNLLQHLKYLQICNIRKQSRKRSSYCCYCYHY